MLTIDDQRGYDWECYEPRAVLTGEVLKLFCARFGLDAKYNNSQEYYCVAKYERIDSSFA